LCHHGKVLKQRQKKKKCKTLVCGVDPGNTERVIVQFADGTEVSVKADNCDVIRGAVRLVGLVGAAHLNGCEGVVCGKVWRKMIPLAMS